MGGSDRESTAEAGSGAACSPTDVQRAHAADGIPPWAAGNPLWRLKLRLQFTGWLQYLGPVGPALVLLVVAGMGALIGVAPLLLVGLPLGLGRFCF